MPVSLQSCLNFFAPSGLLCCNVYHCADINFYYTARNVELLHNFSPLFKIFSKLCKYEMHVGFCFSFVSHSLHCMFLLFYNKEETSVHLFQCILKVHFT